MQKLNPAYGFQKNIFAMLKEKATMMEEADRHGEFIYVTIETTKKKNNFLLYNFLF